VRPLFCHWKNGNIRDKHKETRLLTYFPDRECFNHNPVCRLCYLSGRNS